MDRGSGRTESRSFSVAGGMCPRCEGPGTATDIDLTQLYDERRSLAQGAITIPGYTADGWSVRMFTESGFLDPDKPIRDYTATERHDFLHKEPVKVRISGINLTYEGTSRGPRNRSCPRTSTRCTAPSAPSWSER